MFRTACLISASMQSIMSFVAQPVHAQIITNAEEGSRSFAFGYTLAFLATLLIMVILCSPTRKKGS